MAGERAQGERAASGAGAVPTASRRNPTSRSSQSSARRAAKQPGDAIPAGAGAIAADEACVAVVVERDREQRDRHGHAPPCRSQRAVVSSAMGLAARWPGRRRAATAKTTFAKRVPDRRRNAPDRHLLDREAPAAQHRERERDADCIAARQHARGSRSTPARARARAGTRGPGMRPSTAVRTSGG